MTKIKEMFQEPFEHLSTSRHSRASGNPFLLEQRRSTWIPACAGMTTLFHYPRMRFRAAPTPKGRIDTWLLLFFVTFVPSWRIFGS
jgi:hypothetical protein